jgi:membrane protein
MPLDPRSTSPGAGSARERSLGEMVRELGADAAQLLRQEVALAKAEMREFARAVAGAAARIAMGAGVAVTGLLTLLAALVVLLGALIGSYWLSALIVGLLLVAVGGWMAYSGGQRLKAVDPKPRLAVNEMRGTLRWAGAEAAGLRGALTGKSRGDRASRGALPPAGAATPPARVTAERSPAPRAPAAARPERTTAAPEAAVGPGATAAATRRGRQPPRREEGTLAFLKHVGAEIKEDEITGHAAKLAYYAFMAMPPALMALFGLAGLIGSERLAGWLQQQAAVAMPAAVSEGIIGPFIEQVVLNKAPGPFSIGLLLALWGGSSVFLGLMDTLNNAFDVEDSRSFVKKRSMAVGIMIGSVILFVAAAGTLLVGPAVVDAVGLGRAGEIFWSLVQWPIAFLFMVAAFWAGYYFLPNRDQSACKKVLVKAAALAAGLWVLATAAFRVYIANFSSYSETYGFLGAFIILLLWLYVTGLVVLAGGELASEMEKRA